MAGTTFHSFTADTIARAADMNDNFAFLEGDFNPHSTGAAADNSKDLGTSTNRWRDAFIGNRIIIDGAAPATPATNAAYASSILKVWVNFDGIVASPTTTADLNVSSITDNGGTGDFTVTFATAFANVNYCFAGGIAGGAGAVRAPSGGNSTGALRIITEDFTSQINFSVTTVAVFGEQS